jgi:diaminopimelate epimerase
MPLKTFEFPLIKAEATGNDFLVVDLLDSSKAGLWEREFGGKTRSDLVKTLCDRYTGLGADGMVFLEPKSGVNFKWDFYNSDGSSAEMCGNAARAVSHYVGLVTGQKDLKFETRVGVIRSEVHGAGDIEVQLPAIAEQEFGEAFDFIRPGVPHVVVRAKNLDDIAGLTEQALSIKALPRFKRDGTNVTFIRTVGDNHLQAKTHERGVEGFTKSCGTGAIAAAHSVLRGAEGRTIQVDVPGGRLSVVWKQGQPILRGPARIVGEMRWIRE